jgi:hypothetical protein
MEEALDQKGRCFRKGKLRLVRKEGEPTQKGKESSMEAGDVGLRRARSMKTNER